MCRPHAPASGTWQDPSDMYVEALSLVNKSARTGREAGLRGSHPPHPAGGGTTGAPGQGLSAMEAQPARTAPPDQQGKPGPMAKTGAAAGGSAPDRARSGRGTAGRRPCPQTVPDPNPTSPCPPGTRAWNSRQRQGNLSSILFRGCPCLPAPLRQSWKAAMTASATPGQVQNGKQGLIDALKRTRRQLEKRVRPGRVRHGRVRLPRRADQGQETDGRRES